MSGSAPTSRRRRRARAPPGPRRRLGDGPEGRSGRAADGPPRRTGMGVRHHQLPPLAARDVARSHRGRQASPGVDEGVHRRARWRPRLRGHHRRLGRRAPLLARRPHPDVADFQPGFEDTDTSVQAAVPFYGVYDFVNRHGTSRADMEGFLARRLFKSELERGPRSLGAGVPHQPHRPPRPAVLRPPRHQRLARTRGTGPDLRRRAPQGVDQPVSTPSSRCPARVRDVSVGAEHATVHAVERFLAVVRSEQGGATPAEAVGGLSRSSGLTVDPLVVPRLRPPWPSATRASSCTTRTTPPSTRTPTRRSDAPGRGADLPQRALRLLGAVPSRRRREGTRGLADLLQRPGRHPRDHPVGHGAALRAWSCSRIRRCTPCTAG